MTFKFPPIITKEFILSKVSEEEIFEMYGVHVVPYLFKSPIRKDTHPTCKFYRRQNGKLILRDYAGYFWGDCFDFVIQQTGKQFHKALEDIAVRFKLVENNQIVVTDKLPIQSKVTITPTLAEIKIKRMEWTPKHLKFWSDLGIFPKTLELFKVFPVERVWLNNESVFWYGAKKEIVFAYHFPEYGQYEYKIYFPSRDKFRFLHSTASIIQGFHRLPESGEVLVVTKSYKDVIALYEFGIPAIAPMAETMIIDQYHAEILMNRFEKIFTLYDIDRLAGVRSMQEMKKLYGWYPLFFNVRKKQPKDFTDFILRFGLEDTKLLIDDLKTIFL